MIKSVTRLRDGNVVAMIGLVGLLAVVIGVGVIGIDRGGFGYPDDSRHAVSGTMLLDLLIEGRLLDPVNFAKEYYARYPCLCIPYYAPPLFHAVEAVFFGLFGVSTVTAHHSILFFHVLTVCLLFALCRRESTTFRGLATAALFSFAPIVVEWSRHIVLEPPALFFIVLATLLLFRYEDSPTRGRFICWFLAVLASLLTKQTAIFVIPLHLAYMFRRGLLGRRTGIAAFCSIMGVVIAYGLYWVWYSPYHIESVASLSSSLASLRYHLFYYPSRLTQMIGILPTAFATWGLTTLFLKRADRLDQLMAGWLIVFFAMMLCFSRHVDRYGYLAVPCLAYFAVRGIEWITGYAPVRWRPLVQIATAVLIAYPTLWSALNSRPRFVDGYESAAHFISQHEGGSAIFFDGYWDGDFVFFCRQHDPYKRLVLRGSKMLYTYASYRWNRFQSFVQTPEDILSIFDECGVRFVVVEEEDQSRTHEGEMLRQLLKSGRFRHLARFDVRADKVTRLEAKYLDAYEYLDSKIPAGKALRFVFPGLGMEILVPFPKEQQSHLRKS